MQNLEEKGTFKTEAMKDISHRLKEGEGARWECLAKSLGQDIMSYAHLASVPLLKRHSQTKSKSGKSGQCSVLVQQVLPKASLHCCLHSPQRLHLHVCVEIQIKLSPTQCYKQSKLQVSATHTCLGSPFYHPRFVWTPVRKSLLYSYWTQDAPDAQSQAFKYTLRLGTESKFS